MQTLARAHRGGLEESTGQGLEDLAWPHPGPARWCLGQVIGLPEPHSARL